MRQNVIIVEDSDVNRAILIELLKNKYNVFECDNGEEAIELIRNTSDIVLVLLDLVLPTISGIDVLKALTPEEKELKPILVISASSDYDDQKEAFLNGAFDYIVKPFDIKLVGHRIENAIFAKTRLLELKKQLEIVQISADYDGLTGIYTRKKSEELMKEYIANHPCEKYGLLIFDLDNFKLINDLEGHQVGDLTLKKTSKLISSYFRPTDIVGRLGGDEFIVLMTNLKYQDDLISKIDDLVRMLQFNPNITIPANISFSVGGYYNDGKRVTFEEMYKKADIALYKAKEEGKNRFTLYGVEKYSDLTNDTTVTIVTRNRSISEIVSLVAKEMCLKYKLLTGTADLDASVDSSTNQVLILDLSNNINYRDILEKTAKHVLNKDYIICVDEFDSMQMSEALKYQPKSIITIPTSIEAVRRNIRRFILDIERRDS